MSLMIWDSFGRLDNIWIFLIFNIFDASGMFGALYTFIIWSKEAIYNLHTLDLLRSFDLFYVFDTFNVDIWCRRYVQYLYFKMFTTFGIFQFPYSITWKTSKTNRRTLSSKFIQNYSKHIRNIKNNWSVLLWSHIISHLTHTWKSMAQLKAIPCLLNNINKIYFCKITFLILIS